MKKTLAALALIAATFSSATQAMTYVGPGGIIYGNICRAGIYWQIVPFLPVGAGCFTAWGPGFVTME